MFVSGYLVRDIPLATERTWYTLYGDVFAYLLLGLCAMSLVSSFWVDRRESLSVWRRKLRGTWMEPS